jgi:ribosome biogenesis GTPase
MTVAGKRPRKVRVDFQKKRTPRRRPAPLTPQVWDELEEGSAATTDERLTGKGELTRRRTVLVEGAEGAAAPRLAVDEARCLRGRVLHAIGAQHCAVQTPEGRRVECVVRRLVRTLARDARSAVVAGDEVLWEPTGPDGGVIVRVEPRRSTISRGSAHREHVIAANIDQAVIVVSVVNPPLKPALIDRFLVSAEKGGVRAVVCLSKVDLIDPTEVQPIAGVYARIGYDVVLTSLVTGQGLARLRELLAGRESVLTGQSGVGKSSLINTIDPALELPTQDVSADSGKGRHTTRVAELLPLSCGGWIVDTPGVRQMQLWNVAPGEVEGYFREFRPFVPDCRFPDCTHTHEEGCGIQRAVHEGLIAATRYEGYLRILLGDSGQ